ncbi:cobalt-precorrin-5B C(1)-methyltransferase [Clostridiales bacterium]|nr:cobalt-precorrin-5B C(1)-methyltransferase [Clostridiales bacterium]
MAKYGFTTGSCAAAAAKAAAVMALEKRKIEYISLTTPKGIEFETEIFDAEIDKSSATCAVKKYAGDDPDITDGLLIYATITLKDYDGIDIDGGKGVGRVTKAGLWQKIGEAAINKIPREMIKCEVAKIFDLYGHKGGAKVIISVPNGENVAKKTLNPALGIVGGISILGTSGIVEPMSTRAILDSIDIEMKVKRVNDGKTLIMTPGNYGAEFIKNNYGIEIDRALKCSNFIGEAVDMAVEKGFSQILLIGHVGKLIKLSGGIMDTHSRNADCRIELMTAAALNYTDDINILKSIAKCKTTEAAIDILHEEDILEPTMELIMNKADYYINKRAQNKIEIGLIMFSNENGVLGKTNSALKILETIKEN